MNEPGDNGNGKSTTTIAIWKNTKDRLDKHRAPGQCYNGFICQLIELWEKEKPSKGAGSRQGRRKIKKRVKALKAH